MISNNLWKATLTLGISVVIFGLAGIGWAQKVKGKSRPLLTKQLMGGLVQPNCASLGKGLKEKPADDKAWADLAMNAALLNEASHILVDDGRCPDGVWAEACKTLREKSATVLEKVSAKDQAGASAAFSELTQACATCHKAHKQ